MSQRGWVARSAHAAADWCLAVTVVPRLTFPSLRRQVAQLRERLTAVKKVLESKDDMSAEDIKKEVTDLQQQSLKLFEMAYKKVSGP